MRIIGLTGGIASGKSTVSAMLRKLGAEVLDADALAREVVEPGQPALAEIADRFPEVIRADGTLDRAALGARVFARPEERAALNAITHPRIREAFARKTAALERQGVTVVIYDAALLIENKLYEGMDGVILVVAPPELQLARLIARDGLTVEQARQRIASQMPLAEKLPHATWIVDNAGDVARTQARVEEVWREVQR